MDSKKLIRIIINAVAFVLCIVMVLMIAGESKADHSQSISAGSSLGLTLAKILAGAAVLGALVLAGKNLANNPRGAIKVGIAIVVMVIIYFVGRSMDAGELYPDYGVTETSESNHVGGILTLTYALGIVSAIVFVAALIMSVIKK